MLTAYEGRDGHSIDLYESISNILLSPLRTSLGVTLHITSEESRDPVAFDMVATSSDIVRVVAGIFALVILPFTLLGLYLAAQSKTYQDLSVRLSVPSEDPLAEDPRASSPVVDPPEDVPSAAGASPTEEGRKPAVFPAAVASDVPQGVEMAPGAAAGSIPEEPVVQRRELGEQSLSVDLSAFVCSARVLSDDEVRETLKCLEKGLYLNFLSIPKSFDVQGVRGEDLMPDDQKFEMLRDRPYYVKDNLNLFATMRAKGHQAPEELSLPFLNFDYGRDPHGFGFATRKLTMEPGKYYQLADNDAVTPVEREVVDSGDFGVCLMKREQTLYALLDGQGKRQKKAYPFLRVGSDFYLASAGPSSSEPALRLYEGDHVYARKKYLGCVTSAGDIEQPGAFFAFQECMKGGVEQARHKYKTVGQQFKAVVLKRRDPDAPPAYAEQIVETLQPGFIVPDMLTKNFAIQLRMTNQAAMLMHMPDRDPNFVKFVEYFKLEKAVLALDVKQLVLRIGSFLLSVASDSPYTNEEDEEQDQIFTTFGAAIHTRTLHKKQIAFLLKAFLDAMEIESTLHLGSPYPWFCGFEPRSGHAWESDSELSRDLRAWNSVLIDGKPWIIDMAMQCAFPCDAPPPSACKLKHPQLDMSKTTAEQRILKYYGLDVPRV
jgi:hypothetical protein